MSTDDEPDSDLSPGVFLPSSPAAARDHVSALLRARFRVGDEASQYDIVFVDALLVTSELVTNAFRHGGGLTGFTAELDGNELCLAVADASVEFPAAVTRLPGQFTAGGYGWPMVCRLVKSVTVRLTGTGKRIEAIMTLA